MTINMKTYSPFKTLFVLITILLGNQAAAQICAKDNTPETISVSNYDLSQAGEIKIKNPLTPFIWQRCFYGQQWNDAQQICTGTPKKLSWQDALKATENSEWRLPNIKELLSLVDLQCFAPPLHPELFPSAPASLTSGIWTSSPLQTNLDSSSITSSAWLVDLGHGKLSHQNITALNFVLFIKNQ